jgi:hypothetical protein
MSRVEVNAELEADSIHWKTFSKFVDINVLSDNFIDKFINELDWICISIYQDLTEEFMQKFSYKIDWVSASLFQTMSEQFIREFQHKVCWDHLLDGPTGKILSKEFRDEFKDRFNISD